VPSRSLSPDPQKIFVSWLPVLCSSQVQWCG
jgi:hypothetical protein